MISTGAVVLDELMQSNWKEVTTIDSMNTVVELKPLDKIIEHPIDTDHTRLMVLRGSSIKLDVVIDLSKQYEFIRSRDKIILSNRN